MSVFPDGVDLATAERIARDVGVVGDPARVLARLVDASMIEADLEGHPRYRMLDTLRAFGLDRLEHEHERGEAASRLVGWATDLATWIDALSFSERESEADAVLRREVPNLRAAWRVMRRESRLDEAITFATALCDAAYNRDLPEVWRWFLELADDAALDSHPRSTAALGVAAAGAWMAGDPDRSKQLASRGFEAATDDEGRYWCLAGLANVALSSGDYREAVRASLAAAPLRGRPTESYGIAALAAAYSGDLEGA